MKIDLTDNEIAALAMLKSAGVPVLEAAHVACVAFKAGRGRVRRLLKCLAAGEVALRQQEKTVSFSRAMYSMKCA